ncbi:hypothetical protein WJ12_20525 [Burkholderia seminalis]|nr:hypothetical protein WJ12_20525 [Burkholderia seminalis]KVF43701.1 hypothetical protein WJ13_29850 [Burkholderia seminalis]
MPAASAAAVDESHGDLPAGGCRMPRNARPVAEKPRLDPSQAGVGQAPAAPTFLRHETACRHPLHRRAEERHGDGTRIDATAGARPAVFVTPARAAS